MRTGIFTFSALLLALSLTACSDSSSSGGGPVAPTATGVTGSVAANFVTGATITVFRIDTSTRNLDQLTTTTTDSNGDFSFTVNGGGPFLLVATGGSYTDEATGMSRSLGSTVPSNLDTITGRQLMAILGTGVIGNRTTHLSPVTTMATARVAELAKADSDNLNEATVLLIHQQLGGEFGLGSVSNGFDPRDIRPVEFTDAANMSFIQANLTDNGVMLGAILAGLSQEANNTAPALADPLDLVDSLSQDFADGHFNGARPTGPGQSEPITQSNGELLPSNAGFAQLSAATQDFLDNNARDLSGTSNVDFATTLLAALSQNNIRDEITNTNRSPLFNDIADQTVNEDAGPQMLTITGITAGSQEEDFPSTGSPQVVTFSASSSNTALIPNPTFTGSGATRMLNFTPAADANGSVQITVTAMDDGGTANSGINSFVRTFDITVTAVNDPPTLDAINDLMVPFNSPQVTVNLSGISGGPSDEDQNVTVTVMSSDTNVIPTPSVSPMTGTTASRSLSFTPNTGSSGVITLTVTATDSMAATQIRTFMVDVDNGISVTSVVPAVALNAGGTKITVETSGFTADFMANAPMVTVGGVAVSNFNALSNTRFECEVPAGTTGSATLNITSGNETEDFPSFEYVAPVAMGEVIINEFFPDPNGPAGVFDSNGDGTASSTQDEFVEIVNTRNTAIDITGFALRDDIQIRHVFPNPSTIPAGGSVVVFSGGTPTNFPADQSSGYAQTASNNSLSLNNSNDSITLEDSNATVFDTQAYTVSPDGLTFNRAIDGDSASNFVAHDMAVAAMGGTPTGNRASPGTKSDGTSFP